MLADRQGTRDHDAESWLSSQAAAGDANGARFHSILRNDLLAMVVDSGGRLQFANGRLLELGGWRWQDIRGRVWYDVWVPGSERQVARELFERRRRRGDPPSQFEVAFTAADGTVRTIAWASNIAIDDAGAIVSLTGVGIDVTRWANERNQLAAKLDYNTTHDPLTGLASQARFRKEFATTLRAAQGGTPRIATIVLNIDRFRPITEAVGHQVSDLLLREVGRRIVACSPGALTSRFAGDEFAVLLGFVRSYRDAAEAAQRIIDILRKPFRVRGTEFHLAASAGVALSPDDGDEADQLLRNASMAMRFAKAEGGDRFAMFRAALSSEAEERRVLEHQLRGAVQRKELTLHYQPQVDAETHRIVGMEALARWDNPVLGSVPPGQFIPVAEETGMIMPIGLWVLRAACEQATVWRDEGIPSVPIAVNVSARQLASGTLVDDVTRILAETGIGAEFLELEVTESAVMADMDAAAEVLRQLGAMGIKISLDDFGTGYSCISYLNYLSVKTIKIDRSFLQASPVVEDANALVRALVLLARSLRLRVIAEGVETDEQLSRLKGEDERCDAYQGFLFSHPLAAADARRLLLRSVPLPV